MIGDRTAALYLYCIVPVDGSACPRGDGAWLEGGGIDALPVFLIPYRDLSAIVHAGSAQPYQSQDQVQVEAWLLAQHRVVESAQLRWGAVLPVTFNTIIKAGPDSACGNLVTWLQQEYDRLRAELDAVSGRAEYGVRVFWDPAVVSRSVSALSPALRELEAEILTKPRGAAYLYRQRLTSLLRQEVTVVASAQVTDCYERISRCADRVRIEGSKRDRDQAGHELLLNLSCLLSPDQLPYLAEQLDWIEAQDGYSVSLAGPFPPYSFC